MIAVLGSLLGLGLLLTISPLLWPTTARRSRVGGGALDIVRQRLAQAGLQSVTVPALLVLCVLCAIIAGAVCFALFPVGAVATIAAVAAAAAPIMVVNWRARNRARALRTIWPDVVDHLVSGVRSGLALPDSLMILAHTGPPPVRALFAAFGDDYRATGNFTVCLDRLKQAVADPVADRIIETLRMSREVGGSELTTVLRNLSSYLRSEAAIRAEVEARQSWVLTAAKLGVVAPWVVLLLLATRSEAARAYNSLSGVLLIVGGLFLTAMAYRLMLAIGRIPAERRWFS